MAVRDLVKFFGNRDKTLFRCPLPVSDFHEKKQFSVSAMSDENRPPTVNRITPSKADSYWFAHSGVDDDTSPGSRNNPKSAEGKEGQLQKEREERIRLFREQQEEGRIKRLKEIEQSFELSRKHREQQEEERRRKIEEARIRENERRQQVEERKRQIWEAEQERKEAILRRNLEREARIEARRNAQRNSLCFAFGSSTPRTFDLDLAALGNAALGCSLMSSVSVKRSDEKDIGVKRATSACSLDRKAEGLDLSFTEDDSTSNRNNCRAASAEPEFSPVSIAKQIAIKHMKSEETKACLTISDDNSSVGTGSSFINSDCPSSRWLIGSGALVGDDCMSRSMISLSSASRGRRRTDLTPIMPRERSVTPHTAPRGNLNMRAVSMTRLDQLAQPRRRFLESPRDSSSTATPIGPRTVSPSMSKSMCNLANAPPPKRLIRASTPRSQNMSHSMLHLPGSNRNQGTFTKPSTSPTSPPYYQKPLTPLRSAQSMTHLAIAPRLTRAARLRADALSNVRQEGKTTSMMNLHKSDSYYPGKLSGKDGSRSPSRPQSSMSGRSEISATSSQASNVSQRPRPPPRKPRPVSIAGTTVDRLSLGLHNALDKQSRPSERSGAPPLGPKPVRTKSSDIGSIVKNQPAQKPVPPPKSAQVLAKAKSHPVPTKDNLRKGAKMATESKKELPNASDSASEVSLPSSPKSQTLNSGEAVQNDKNPSPEPNQEILTNQSNPEMKADQPPSNIIDVTTLPSTEAKSEREVSPNQEMITEGISADSLQTKPRITSEEEAKAALAEKRRLAREQLEREAELERQRQEELRRQEEERRIQEELEQKRQEEEQIRLAELHRKLEEEKLQKAIEEQQQREKEEKARKEEEARLRLEKEEQDKKAREEAERLRIESEERLRKEELERAERKKRVEQIMSRTRNKSNAANKQMASPANEDTPSSAIDTHNQSTESVVKSNSSFVISDSAVPENSVSNTDSCVTTQANNVSTNAAQPLNLDILMTHSNVKNGYHDNSIEQSFLKSNTITSANCVPNRTPNSEDALSPLQTNGYNSHEDMSLTSSPEDKSEKSDSSDGLLLDLGHLPPPNLIPKGCSDQLIELGGSTHSSNDNYIIHPDVVNSNLVSSDPFHTFENNLPKKQETAITDLLS